MIIVQCDGCYKQLPTPEIGEMFHKSITVLAITERYPHTSNDKVHKSFHLCENCRTARRTLYFDNPYFVEPPEAAKDEQKASQGS